MGNAESSSGGSGSQRRLKREKSSSSNSQRSISVKAGEGKDDKCKMDYPIPEAVVVDAADVAREQRKEEMRKVWMRDELYSPQWLFAMATKQNLVTDADMKILMEHEFDVFLIKKYGDEKLKELGVSEGARKNLIQLASNM